MELTSELKQKIVDELNSDQSEPESAGNTQLFNMGSMEELQPFLKELTPLEMFDKSVVLNQTSIANLVHVLPKMSKRNIIKLLFATLKLPEPGATLKFGGKQEELRMCEFAYANTQMARNSLIHVLGTTSIAQARLVKQREMEAKKKEDEIGNDKDVL